MTRAWAWVHARGMRKALEAGAGLGRVWAGLASARADGAAAHHRRARRGCWGAL